MIVWLASYPRSGNTLTRTILSRVFRLETYSEYNDLYDLGSRDDVSASVGHRIYDGRWEDAFIRLAADPAIRVVKTHGPPKDGQPAIYVVRDARSALVSLRHFFHDHPLTPLRYSMRQLIDGAAIGGDWSGHLAQWAPLRRPHTLFLRYEELVEDPDRAIALIARFLGLPRRAAWRNPFERQRALLPSFFRRGSDAANLAEWTPRDLDRFWDRHERWMRILGYGTRLAATDAARPLWRPRSRIIRPDFARDGRLKLGPEPQPGIAADGFFGCELHRGQLCRWTTGRLRLTVPSPGDRPLALEIALWGYGPENHPVTIRANGAVVFEGPRSALAAARLPLDGIPQGNGALEIEFLTMPFSTVQDPRPLGVFVRDLALVQVDVEHRGDQRVTPASTTATERSSGDETDRPLE